MLPQPIYDMFGSDKTVVPSEEICTERGHSVEERFIDGDPITVCAFKYGGWCEIGEYNSEMCGE